MGVVMEGVVAREDRQDGQCQSDGGFRSSKESQGSEKGLSNAILREEESGDVSQVPDYDNNDNGKRERDRWGLREMENRPAHKSIEGIQRPKGEGLQMEQPIEQGGGEAEIRPARVPPCSTGRACWPAGTSADEETRPATSRRRGGVVPQRTFLAPFQPDVAKRGNVSFWSVAKSWVNRVVLSPTEDSADTNVLASGVGVTAIDCLYASTGGRTEHPAPNP